VAFAAHVYVEVAFAHGRSSNEVVAAATANSYWNIIWMNFWFHDFLPVYCVPPPERKPSTAQRLRDWLF
jgi:hypothetical protein